MLGQARSHRRVLWATLWLLGSLSCHGGAAYAGELRIRAREHYETIDLQTASGRGTYYGFTNTINVWYEEPFHYSIGFAGSPLFAVLRSGAAPARYSDTIRLVHLGAEAKVFPIDRVFARLGLYQADLYSHGDVGELPGQSALLGGGYEFDLGGIGLAPEMAWRWGKLSNDVRFTGTAPAIGLHFYKYL